MAVLYILVYWLIWFTDIHSLFLVKSKCRTKSEKLSISTSHVSGKLQVSFSFFNNISSTMMIIQSDSWRNKSSFLKLSTGYWISNLHYFILNRKQISFQNKQLIYNLWRNVYHLYSFVLALPPTAWLVQRTMLLYKSRLLRYEAMLNFVLTFFVSFLSTIRIFFNLLWFQCPLVIYLNKINNIVSRNKFIDTHRRKWETCILRYRQFLSVEPKIII